MFQRKETYTHLPLLLFEQKISSAEKTTKAKYFEIISPAHHFEIVYPAQATCSHAALFSRMLSTKCPPVTRV